MKMYKHNYPYEPQCPLYRDIRELLTESVNAHGDKIAFTYKNRGSDKTVQTVTFAQLGADVRALGTWCLQHGYAGRHVALIGKLSYEWIMVYFAMLSIGAVLVPLDKDWTEADLADTVSRASCTYLFCDGDLKSKADAIGCENPIEATVCFGETWTVAIEALLEEGRALVRGGDTSFDTHPIDPMALALLVYTSGTTGKGKGVMHNHNALVSNIYGAFCILKTYERTLAVLPPHHTFGSTINLLSSVVGGVNTYLSSGIRYVVNELKLHKPQYLILVPLYLETFYKRIWATAKETGKEKLLRRLVALSEGLRKIGIDLRDKFFRKRILSAFGGEIRFAVSGGAPLSREVMDGFEAFGLPIINGYGITECAPLIAANRFQFITPGSVGVGIPNVDIKIIHPTEGGEGEICVKGPNVMMGYYGEPEATAEAIDSDGYFHTGDIGKLDANGALFITGRLKNLIILSNGKNVYPEEIEASFAGIDGIKDLVVYEGVSRRGVEYNAIVLEVFPDEDWMKQAGVTDFEGYIKPFVDAYNREAVPYKKIGLVRVRDTEFPKNTLRKITRFKLDRTIE